MKKIGEYNFVKRYIGSNEVKKIYKGSNLIWEEDTIQLPYDTEIEFLESSGTLYIDTDILVNSTDFEIGYVVEGYGAWGWVHLNSSNGTWITVANNSTNNNCKWWYGNFEKLGSINNFLIGFYSVVYKFREGIDINEYTESFSGIIGNDNISNVSLKFFSRYDFRYNLMETNLSSSKFKSFYVKIDGVLMADFIPVRVGQIGYMYDKVSGQLFGNSGTGNFILGPDICLLSEFLELEYLESDGNQYINTYLEIGSCDFKITTWLNISFGFIHNNKSSGTFITADTTNRTDSIWYEYDGYNNGVINNVSLNSDTKISYDMQNGLFINDVKVASFLSVVKSDSIHGYGMPIGTKYDFNTNSFITATRNIHIILRRYIIEKSGTTVMDLIPVKRISDGTLGMYDLILGLFFTNNGTGTFIAGPYVLP